MAFFRRPWARWPSQSFLDRHAATGAGDHASVRATRASVQSGKTGGRAFVAATNGMVNAAATSAALSADIQDAVRRGDAKQLNKLAIAYNAKASSRGKAKGVECEENGGWTWYPSAASVARVIVNERSPKLEKANPAKFATDVDSVQTAIGNCLNGKTKSGISQGRWWRWVAVESAVESEEEEVS
jgi:hypothetical protein